MQAVSTRRGIDEAAGDFGSTRASGTMRRQRAGQKDLTMTRVVFFSFHYDDVWRVNQVRNSGRFSGEQRAGFRDKAEYEQVQRSGDAAIRAWIRS